MKIFRKFFFICLTLVVEVAKTFDYCEIQFPKTYESFPAKFDIFTNNGKQKFTNVKSYIPGKTYDITVSLKHDMRDSHLTIKEIYVLINEIQSEDEDSEEKVWKNGGEIVFNVTHASKTEYCNQRAFVHYLYTQPQQVTFYWIAPKIPKICLRITVILNMNDVNFASKTEEISHIICDQTNANVDGMQSDQIETANCKLKKKPDQAKKCNILSSAVYRMTIENKWNSLNHWKDWPGKDGYTPRLTQYLGASHSNDFDIYYLGGMASAGVLQVCSNGSYNLLQQQFYKAGNGIKTVILARSLDASSKTSKRSAIVVVNSTSHLVSFLSRLDPSPDWCTGLSRFDLCGGKCQWPDKVTAFLFPWDAGIYSGETYVYKKELHVQEPICPITSTWPKDNPFTVLNGDIQAIGIVTFKLIQELNKHSNSFCHAENTALQDEAYFNDQVPKSSQYGFLKSAPDKTRHCLLTEWSEWSQCSKSCGKGEKVRYRKFIKGIPEKCVASSLKDIESCHPKCSPLFSKETCSMRLWSPWSPCNATCSQSGITYRERVFIDEQEKQECVAYSEMKTISTCIISSDRCQYQTVCKEYVNDGDMCIWSSPSQRYYFDFVTGDCNSFQYKGCYGGLNNFHTYEECSALCILPQKNTLQYRSNTPMTFENRCLVPMTWGFICDSELPKTRWSFDKIHRKCFKFHFNGCRGNANNFKTKYECENVCLSSQIMITTNSPQQPSVIECLYSEWSEWSVCDENCEAWQARFRTVNENIDVCKENLREMRKCPVENCRLPKIEAFSNKKCKYTNWSAWTVCSSRCGQGVRERKRKKLSSNCIPEFPQYNERESCYNACAFY